MFQLTVTSGGFCLCAQVLMLEIQSRGVRIPFEIRRLLQFVGTSERSLTTRGTSVTEPSYPKSSDS